MPTINTPMVDFASWSNTANADIFTPATGALPTTQYKEILTSIWLSALTTNAKARWGIRFSDDGVTWDAPAKVNVAGGYATAVGWTFGNVWTDITSVSGTTHKLFFQLGIMGLNNSGTAVEGGQARLTVQCKPLVSNSLVLGPRRVWCTGNGSSVFIPFSGPIPASDMSEVRGSIEMNGTTGHTSPTNSRIGITCALQQANKPDDPSDWTGTTTFGTQRTTDGITYGTTFGSPGSFTKRYVRFGVSAINIDTNSVEVCQATIRVDYRR